MNAVKLYIREILREVGNPYGKGKTLGTPSNVPFPFSSPGPQVPDELRDAADEVDSKETTSADVSLQKEIDGIIADVIKADDDQSKTRGVPGSLITYGDLVYRAAVIRDLLGKDKDAGLIYPYRTALYTIGWETEVYDFTTFWNEFKQNTNLIWKTINLPNVYNTQKPMEADPTSAATEHDKIINNIMWGTGITLTGIAAFATGHVWHLAAHSLMSWAGKWITTLEAVSMWVAERCRLALNNKAEWQKFLKLLEDSGAGDEAFSTIFRALRGFIDDIPYNRFLKMMSDIIVKSKALQAMRTKYASLTLNILTDAPGGGTVPLGSIKYSIDDLLPDLSELQIREFAIETLRRILNNVYEARKVPTSESMNEFFTSFSSLWPDGDPIFVKFAKFLDDASVEGGIESSIRKKLADAKSSVAPPPSVVQAGKKSKTVTPAPIPIRETHVVRFADPQAATDLKSAAGNLKKVILDSPVIMDTLVHRMLMLGKARTALGRGTAYSVTQIARAVGTLGLFSFVTMAQQDIYVSEDEAKSLITDATIRAAAVKSLRRHIDRDIFTFTKLETGTADNNLLTLFNTPSPSVCDDGLWDSTIQSYNLVVTSVDPDDYDQILGTTSGGESTP